MFADENPLRLLLKFFHNNSSTTDSDIIIKVDMVVKTISLYIA